MRCKGEHRPILSQPSHVLVVKVKQVSQHSLFIDLTDVHPEMSSHEAQTGRRIQILLKAREEGGEIDPQAIKWMSKDFHIGDMVRVEGSSVECSFAGQRSVVTVQAQLPEPPNPGIGSLEPPFLGCDLPTMAQSELICPNPDRRSKTLTPVPSLGLVCCERRPSVCWGCAQGSAALMLTLTSSHCLT